MSKGYEFEAQQKQNATTLPPWVNGIDKRPVLPTDSNVRKDVPLARGVLDYFPAALAEVARLSIEGNRKHNPGEDLHWARGKSSDHADCIMRHLAERGLKDTDGFSHSVKVAWRALALLQEELEVQQGAPFPRGARYDDPNKVAQSTPLGGVTCRGSYALGSACGHCARCDAERAALNESKARPKNLISEDRKLFTGEDAR